MSSCWWWWWHGAVSPSVVLWPDSVMEPVIKLQLKCELSCGAGMEETETQRSPHPGRWRPSQCHLPPSPGPAYDTLTRSPAAPELCSTPGVITGHQGLTWFRLTRVRTRVFSIILTTFLVFILNGIQNQMNGNSKTKRTDLIRTHK